MIFRWAPTARPFFGAALSHFWSRRLQKCGRAGLKMFRAVRALFAKRQQKEQKNNGPWVNRTTGRTGLQREALPLYQWRTRQSRLKVCSEASVVHTAQPPSITQPTRRAVRASIQMKLQAAALRAPGLRKQRRLSLVIMCDFVDRFGPKISGT